MQDVLDLLLLKGFSLQLKHEEKETHNGFVTLFDENGVKLAHSPKIQIMFMSNREQMVESFVNEGIESYHRLNMMNDEKEEDDKAIKSESESESKE
jgi:hypothetical protein